MVKFYFSSLNYWKKQMNLKGYSNEIFKLAVIITNKKGNAYQVDLTNDEVRTIESLISQLHNGKIKALKSKLKLTLN